MYVYKQAERILYVWFNKDDIIYSCHNTSAGSYCTTPKGTRNEGALFEIGCMARKGGPCTRHLGEGSRMSCSGARQSIKRRV